MISNRLSKLVLLGCVTFSLTALSGISFAQSNPSQAPVNFDADNLSHDETGQIITATGSVVMTQAGKTVRADKVTYNLKNDTVIGEGNVVFEDVNGDKGKLRGKPPKLSDLQQRELLKMHATGEYSISDLGKLFKVSRPTVYRTIRRGEAAS